MFQPSKRFCLLVFSALILNLPYAAAGENTLPGDHDGDGDLDDLSAPTVIAAPVTGTCPLTLTWQAPPWLTPLSDAATGDPDGDGKASIIIPHFGYPGAHVFDFENSGDNAFSEVWSSGSRKVGAYGAVGTGDLEGNGQGAIFAAQYGHTLRTFHNSGDDVYAEGIHTPLMIHYEYAANTPFTRDMDIADTDGDGVKEVIVLVSKDVDPTVGILSIHAHDGSQVYAKITDSYLWGVSSGHFDDDEYLDIFVMGWAAQTLTVGWFEYDGKGYVYRKIILPERGRPLASAVADTDGDGRSELLVAGLYDGQRQLLVLDAVADNTARLREQIPYPSTTNPMDIAVGYVWNGGFPEIAVATHNSGGLAQIFFFRYDGSSHGLVCHTGSELPAVGAFYSVDLTFADGDNRADIVIGASGSTLVLEADTAVVPPAPPSGYSSTGDTVPPRQEGGIE